jgi:hypothetical protein
MATADRPGQRAATRLFRFHHGTDLTCGNDLLRNGVDRQRAAAWNSSGEYWATTDHARAEWFARSHPNSPPAVCFEFDLPEPVLQMILHVNPPGARHHASNDVEFLPPSYPLLNQHVVNEQLVPLP